MRGRVIAQLVRFLGSIDAAEEAFQEAVLSALATWPERGVPDRLAAWLMTAAKNHARDAERHRRIVDAEAPIDAEDPMSNAETFQSVTDDQLRLVFTCCHPALPLESQVALTLELIAGFSTEETARAFLSRGSCAILLPDEPEVWSPLPLSGRRASRGAPDTAPLEPSSSTARRRSPAGLPASTERSPRRCSPPIDAAWSCRESARSTACCASSHASAICAGVTCFRSAMAVTRSTSARFALRLSVVEARNDVAEVALDRTWCSRRSCRSGSPCRAG